MTDTSVTETAASQTFTPDVYYDEFQTSEETPFTGSVTEEPVSSTEDLFESHYQQPQGPPLLPQNPQILVIDEDLSESHYPQPRGQPLLPQQPQNPQILVIDEDLDVNGNREFMKFVLKESVFSTLMHV